MKKITIITCFLALVFFSSCKKDEFNFMSVNHPETPVSVTNLFGMYNGVPTVSTSVGGGGAITISMSIPSTSGRTIKEISKVGFSTSITNYKVVQASTGLYSSTPIAGSGTTVTFSTTLTEYTAKTGAKPPATPGTATSFLANYFYFLVTLDNGDQVLPVPVRVYVNS